MLMQSTSSVIIRDIKSISNAGPAYLAYFYFDFKDNEKQEYRALLSSFLVQLCNRSEKFCDILFDLYTKNQEGLEQASDDSLAQCLKDMLTVAMPVPIYIVIDALDECPNDSGLPSSRETVLELVKELVELRQPNLRLCILSRPEFDIRTVLEPLATQNISLHDESGQKQDIIEYITSVVRSDQKMKRWRDDDKDAVIEKLTSKADGMYGCIRLIVIASLSHPFTGFDGFSANWRYCATVSLPISALFLRNCPNHWTRHTSVS